MRVESLTLPPDDVLLRHARQQWLQREDQAAVDRCTELTEQLGERLARLDLSGQPAVALDKIQDVVSGAILLRDVWKRHMGAMQMLQDMQRAEAA